MDKIFTGTAYSVCDWVESGRMPEAPGTEILCRLLSELGRTGWNPRPELRAAFLDHPVVSNALAWYGARVLALS